MPAMGGPVHHAARTVPGLVLGLISLASSMPAVAFGPTGHRIAGHIADRLLCAETRVALDPLLGGMSLAEAGLWPDMIRRLPEWEHTKPWHFINVTDRGSAARAARASPDNVLAALARFEHELGDRALGTQQRSIALRFVAHFVVDIHQPLHVGRDGDRGGNLLAVRVAGRDTNLHAVWDGELLRRPGEPSPRALALAFPLPPAASLAQWQQANPLYWARESQALRPVVYGFPAPAAGPVVLSPEYLARARLLVDERLLKAGVRLAGRLNALLGGSLSCPPEVAPPEVVPPEVVSGRPNL